MLLNDPDGEEYRLTVVNPNAPANRCQETLGLCVTLDGPEGWSATRALTEQELETLRSGDPLPLMLGGVEVIFQSNPGGYLVNLDGDEHGAEFS